MSSAAQPHLGIGIALEQAFGRSEIVGSHRAGGRDALGGQQPSEADTDQEGGGANGGIITRHLVGGPHAHGCDHPPRH